MSLTRIEIWGLVRLRNRCLRAAIRNQNHGFPTTANNFFRYADWINLMIKEYS
jgi:hypothetical protein